MPETIKKLEVNSNNTITVDGKPFDDSIVELYENYDRSFADWCNFTYRKGRDGEMLRIPTVFATPERAFAQYGRTLDDKYKKRFNKEVLPLPFISMSRLSIVEDPSRRQYGRIRKRFLTSDNRKWVGGNYPIPINIGYEINIWSKTLKTCDAVRLQLFRKFYASRLVVLDVHHPIPVGWAKVIMRNKGFTDNTNLEPGTTDERMVRHTHAFEIEGWITYDYEITPSVLSGHMEIAVEDCDGNVEIAGTSDPYFGTKEDRDRNLANNIEYGDPHTGTVE